jgi:hypothetical protein
MRRRRSASTIDCEKETHRDAGKRHCAAIKWPKLDLPAARRDERHADASRHARLHLRVHIVEYARGVAAEAIDDDASCARTSRRASIENLSETSGSARLVSSPNSAAVRVTSRAATSPLCCQYGTKAAASKMHSPYMLRPRRFLDYREDRVPGEKLGAL